MSTPYTLAQLSNMMDQMVGRVNALDGQGLPAGVLGTVPAARKWQQDQAEGHRKQTAAEGSLERLHLSSGWDADGHRNVRGA